MSEDTAEKYIIRTRKGYVQSYGQCSGRYYFLLTPEIEKALLLNNRGKAIMIAVKAADMGAVIKIVKTDQRTGRRKTVGTMVFGDKGGTLK